LSDDLVVVLPGIMGSTLVRDGKEVWGASAGAVIGALRSFGGSVRRLRLPPDLGDDDPGDGVAAARLFPDLHVIPGLWSVNLGYDALLERLRRVLREQAGDGAGIDDHAPQLLPFPYDWRLSNRLNGRRLKATVEPALERLRARGGRFAEARVTFVCHSMGGLVARWYVEREGGHELTRRIITLGTPHRGALKGLAELVNGTRRGFGPFALDLSDFARSLPSAYQLLPEYACIADGGGALRKTTETTIPVLDAALVADGARFHAELDAAHKEMAAAYELQPIVGTKQATVTTAAIDGERLELLETIDGADEAGDATVPRLSATPAGLPPDAAGVHWIAARHGALQSSAASLDQLEGVLTANPVLHRGLPPLELGLRVPELVLAGERIPLDATVDGDAALELAAVVRDERGAVVAQAQLAQADERGPAGGEPVGPRARGPHAELAPLPPGGYAVTVGGVGPAAGRVTPLTSPLVVLEAA
jgi:hypothetical protein